MRFTASSAFGNSSKKRSSHSKRRMSMTKLFRSMTIYCLAGGLLFLAAGTSRAQTRPPDVEQLAKTYGLDSWGQIDAVRYTFDLAIPSLKLTLSRTWTWEPKTGNVTYETKDKDGKPVKVSYNRSQLNSAPATWAGYKKAGSLLVSTEHRGTADGSPLHLSLLNVAYKVAGSDKWVDAQ